MTPEELNVRLKTVQLTLEQFGKIINLYCLLDLDKDDFCKIIDAVGFDKLAAKNEYYKWLIQAKNVLIAREFNLMKAKKRLKKLEEEKQQLEEYINNYNPLV